MRSMRDGMMGGEWSHDLRKGAMGRYGARPLTREDTESTERHRDSLCFSVLSVSSVVKRIQTRSSCRSREAALGNPLESELLDLDESPHVPLKEEPIREPAEEAGGRFPFEAINHEGPRARRRKFVIVPQP